MTRKSNLNTIRSINKWCIYWSSRNKSYASLVLFDHKITEFLIGLFYALRMPSSYYVIRRFYTDLVLIEADVQILDFRRLRRFVYLQRWFFLVVASFRNWLRRFIFIRRFSSRAERFSFLHSLHFLTAIRRKLSNTKYRNCRNKRRALSRKWLIKRRQTSRGSKRRLRNAGIQRTAITLRRHVALRNNFMNVKTMLRFLNMQAVSNYYKGAIRRHLMCVIPLVRTLLRRINARRKKHCRRLRKRYSLRIKRQFSLFASSFCKTVLWRLRQSCQVRSRFNDVFSSINILPISSALFLNARSVCLLARPKTIKDVVHERSNRTCWKITYNFQNTTKYKRFYSTKISSNTFRNTVFNKPDKRHVKQRSKANDHPCYRTSKYCTQIYNRPDNVNVMYNTMQSGELRHYDRSAWLYLKKFSAFNLYLEFYSLSHDVALSQLNGIRESIVHKFDPLAGYVPRRAAYNEDFDDLETDRYLYKRDSAAAEERRLAGIEENLKKKLSKNQLLLRDIKTAADLYPDSVKPSGSILSQVNLLCTFLDDKCSVAGLASSHPMNFIPASETAKVQLSYLQATVMKSFHTMIRESAFCTPQKHFFAYCSYRKNLFSKMHVNLVDFKRSPSSYICKKFIRTITYPTRWNAYSWLVFFLILLLLSVVYILYDYQIGLQLQAELDTVNDAIHRRRGIEATFNYMKAILLEKARLHNVIAKGQIESIGYDRIIFATFVAVAYVLYTSIYTPSFADGYLFGKLFSNYWYNNSKVEEIKRASNLATKQDYASINKSSNNFIHHWMKQQDSILETSSQELSAKVANTVNYSELLPGIFSFLKAYGFTFVGFLHVMIFFLSFSICVCVYINSEYYKSTLSHRFLTTRDAFSTVLLLTYLLILLTLSLFPFLWYWYCDIFTDSVFSLPSYDKQYVFADGENIDDYGWEWEDASGVHENPFIRYMIVLPKEGTSVTILNSFVCYKTYYLFFEVCLFVSVCLFPMLVMISLLIFFYPLVVANNQRRFDDLCSRTIQYSWAWVDSDVRNFKSHEVSRVHNYIYKTHLEGWQNLMKLSLFILFIYFTLPAVKMDWFLETMFLMSRENSPLAYELYDKLVHFPCVVFFWCSNIYHTYRFHGYAVVYNKVMNNDIGSIPFDECLDYRRRVILFFVIISAIICCFFLLYCLFYTFLFVGDIPPHLFFW